MESIIRYEKPYSDYKRTEQQEMLIAAPLDLSFKRATTMNGMLHYINRKISIIKKILLKLYIIF